MLKKIKKSLPDETSIKKTKGLGGLRKYVRNPDLWRFNCQSVAIGMAVGVFSAFIPILQILLAIIFAIIFHGNLPVAVASTFISNPLTFVPIVYLSYYVGNLIIGDGNEFSAPQDFNWHFHSFSEFWNSLSTWSLQFGKAFFVGMPIVAVSSAILAYFLVFAIWKTVAWCKKK